jgi:hypothetical protein
MIKQFVQVSAHKDSNNIFWIPANLSLMANQKLTSQQALYELQAMADSYAQQGYTIEWINVLRKKYDTTRIQTTVGH